MRASPRLRVPAALLIAAAALVAPRLAHAGCTTTSASNICVAHNGTAYTIDRGLGPVQQATIPLSATTTFTFEMDPASAALANHPFYITDSPTGGGAGTKLTQPITTGKVTFTPTTATPAVIYYECNIHQGMGGQINVSGGAPVDAGAATDAGGGTDAGTGTGGVDATAPTDGDGHDQADASARGSDAGGDGGKGATSSGGCSAASSSRGDGGPAAMFGLGLAGVVLVRARRRASSR